jgi:hypothetical protein
MRRPPAPRLVILLPLVLAACALPAGTAAAATGCTRRVADGLGRHVLIPYAQRHDHRDYHYLGRWFLGQKVFCTDLNGDGDPEMVFQMQCCTGGSISPWAIFTHGASGRWHMAWSEIHETTFALERHRDVMHGVTPDPYAGVCTRYLRDRVVLWRHGQFRSHLGRRYRQHLGSGCRS